MIVCRQCGHHNDDRDEFCGSCGSFLEFTGDKIPDPVPVPPPEPELPEPEPEGEAARMGLLDRVRDLMGAGDPDPAGAVIDDGAAEPEPADVPGAAEVGPADPPAATPEPPADPVGAVRPQALQPAPPPPPPTRPAGRPPEVPRPGETVCGRCGAGNDPTRRFCRRCGDSLHEAGAVAAPARSWWQRLRRRRRPAVPVTAGARPGRRGSRRRGAKAGIWAKRALALGVVAGVVLLAGPWRSAVSDVYHRVRGTVSARYEPVRPVQADASSALAGHPAVDAIDGIRNSYWAEGADGNGEGQRLTVGFDGPVDLDRVGFTIGASGEPEAFLRQPRPRKVRLHFSDGTSTDLTLRDTAEFQTHKLSARGTSKVDVEIQAVSRGVEGTACSIAEVEFFVRS